MRESVERLAASAAYRSRQIDPAVLGHRIRAARLAAGLTQAELAHPTTSTAYISRIEAGQRRPSDPLLRHIATRAQVSIEHLLFETEDETRIQLRLELRRLEWLETHAPNGQTSTVAGEVAIKAEAVGMTDLANQARIVEARALVAESPAAAAELLETVLSSSGRGASSVQAHAVLCRAYLELGMASRALEVAGAAAELVGVYGLEGLPESLELALAEASARVELGDVSNAIAVCERAIQSAAEIERPAGMEHAYWRASQTEFEHGVFEHAWRHAERATALREVETHAHNLKILRQKLNQLSTINNHEGR